MAKRLLFLPGRPVTREFEFAEPTDAVRFAYQVIGRAVAFADGAAPDTYGIVTSAEESFPLSITLPRVATVLLTMEPMREVNDPDWPADWRKLTPLVDLEALAIA